MKGVSVSVLAALLSAVGSPAGAQAVPAAPSSPVADVRGPPSHGTETGDALSSSGSAASKGSIIPAKTMVSIKIDQPVGSKTSKIGDMFAIELAEPLTENGTVLLPAKLGGQGEIVHAAKANWGGKPGELIIAARFLQCGNRRIPLGHLHFSETGRSNAGAAFVAASVVLPAMFLVAGKDIAIPAGTVVSAQITADVPPPASIEQVCSAPATAVSATPLQR